jgi:hypothetical protein
MTILALLLAACSAASPTVAYQDPMPSRTAGSSHTQTPEPTPAAGCEPTRTRDATGVITSDGRTGIVGETFALGDLLNGSTSVVRRGAIAGDRISVRFDQIGNTAPATHVTYDVDATPLVTPWASVAFKIGWKPIAFDDSCWRLIVDGADTGIVLAVGR